MTSAALTSAPFGQSRSIVAINRLGAGSAYTPNEQDDGVAMLSFGLGAVFAPGSLRLMAFLSSHSAIASQILDRAMTPDEFRAVALSFPRTKEVQVFGSQEFRLGDRAFATLGWPEAGWAVVKLAPGDQLKFTANTRALHPEPGGRGKRGVTRVRLDGLDETLLQSILAAAWRHVSALRASAE